MQQQLFLFLKDRLFFNSLFLLSFLIWNIPKQSMLICIVVILIWLLQAVSLLNNILNCMCILQVSILCNDCNNTSNVRYHILGHKCSHCNSYNTRRISTPDNQWDISWSRKLVNKQYRLGYNTHYTLFQRKTSTLASA